MNAATDRLDFAPPAAPGMLRALGLALVAHAFLVAALTWGVAWRHEAQNLSVSAELWASVPREAAPKLLAPPPELAPEPRPVVAPEPPPPVAPTIVQEQIKKPPPKPVKPEPLPEVKPAPKSAPQPVADTKAQAKQKAAEEAKQLEAQRAQNLQRMTGLAGASGSPGSTGTAQQSSGPSASYAGRIKARVKPNIVFTDEVTGNTPAEVEVRTAPDGTITSRKLLQSSGNKAWDEAVLKAIDKTEMLPRDTDGRVPPTLVISFRPRE